MSISGCKVFNLRENSQIEIKKIVVVGNDRTKLDFFQHELNHQLFLNASVSTGNRAYQLPFSSMYGNLHAFTNRMLSLDLFEACDTNLQIDTYNAKEEKFEAIVKITVKEKGIPFLQAHSSVGAGKEMDFGVELTGALRSPLGYGDRWKVSSIAKQQGSREFLLSATFPHIPNNNSAEVSDAWKIPSIWDISPTCPLSFNVKSCIENAPGLSPYKLSNNSFMVEYNYPNKNHQWQLEYSVRDELPYVHTMPSKGPNEGDNSTQDALSSNSLWKDMIPHSTMWVSSPFSLSGKAPLSNEQPHDQFNKQSLGSNENMHPLFLNLLSSSIKASLKYALTLIDTRNSVCLPTDGSYLQSSVEFATYPGNTHFLKTELNTQFHKTLYLEEGALPDNGATFSVAGSIGLMIPVAYYCSALWNMIVGSNHSSVTSASTDNHSMHHHSAHALPKHSYLSDRFYLGGPLSLRGFNLHGVGPRASHTIHHFGSSNHHNPPHSSHVSHFNNTGLSLGGDCRSVFLAMLSTPLPSKWMTPMLRSMQFRCIYFLNVGAVGNADYWSWQHLHPTTKQLIANRLPSSQHHSSNHHVQGLLSSSIFGHTRASIGSGVCCNLGSTVRLEATYSIPFLYNTHDVLHPFQFGVGLSII